MKSKNTDAMKKYLLLLILVCIFLAGCKKASVRMPQNVRVTDARDEYNCDLGNVIVFWECSDEPADSYNIYFKEEGQTRQFVGSVDGDCYCYFDDRLFGGRKGTSEYQVTAVYGGAESKSAKAIPTDDNETYHVSMYPNPTSGSMMIDAANMSHITLTQYSSQEVVWDEDLYSCDVLNLAFQYYDNETGVCTPLDVGMYSVAITTDGVSCVGYVMLVR